MDHIVFIAKCALYLSCASLIAIAIMWLWGNSLCRYIASEVDFVELTDEEEVMLEDWTHIICEECGQIPIRPEHTQCPECGTPMNNGVKKQ